MWARFLGREDPLEEEMTTHSSILAWRVPWTEEPGGTAVHGTAESDATEHTRMRVALAFQVVWMSVDGACTSSVVNPGT